MGRKIMELIEVICNAHFEDTRIGAVSRKQVVRVPVHVAKELASLNLVTIKNPSASGFSTQTTDRSGNRWWGGTAYVVAGGPSFNLRDAETIAQRQKDTGRRIVAVKDTYRLLPTADIIYGCDEHWWPYHLEKIKALTGPSFGRNAQEPRKSTS
jgi:hypothetical protein